MGDYIERDQAVRELVLDYAYAAADIIKKVPAANVRDDTHGWWKSYHESDFGWDEYGIQCSVCGVRYDSNDVKFKLNFCPYCGANMDKECRKNV